LGRLLAFPTNTGLGWKGLPGTNTLAYYENYGQKKFYNIGPRLPLALGKKRRKRDLVKRDFEKKISKKFQKFNKNFQF
jgi:hypothetical protein